MIIGRAPVFRLRRESPISSMGAEISLVAIINKIGGGRGRERSGRMGECVAVVLTI